MEEDESRPKRRRVIDADDDPSDEDADDAGAAGGNANEGSPGGETAESGAESGDAEVEAETETDAASRRAALLERRAAERRRRRLQAEAAELQADIGATYPGDTQPLPPDDAAAGAAGGAGGGGSSDGDGDDDLDDAVDRDHDLDEGDEEDLDGDYVPEGDEDDLDAGAAGRGGRGRGGGRGGRGRSNPSEAQGFLGNDYDEEEGEGEDLVENAARDYQRIDALDTYGREGIDDRDYGMMGADERAAAEAELARREEEELRRRGGRGMGRSGAFYGALGEVEQDEDDDARAARRGVFSRRLDEEEMDAQELPDEDMDDEERYENEEEVNLEAFDVPLREWIAQDRTRREVSRKFRNFLAQYTEDDDEDDEDHGNNTGAREDSRRRRRKASPLYEQRIRSMCAANRSTLEVSYLHLMQKEPIIAIWVADAPRDMLDILNETATRYALRMFPSYGTIAEEINVRVADVPILDSLRDLRRSHLDCLVKVNGVVTRRSSVYPQLKMAYYDCIKCKYVLGPYRVEEGSTTAAAAGGGGPGGGGGRGGGAGGGSAPDLNSPSSCPSCQSEGPFRLNSNRTQYRNYQRVNLQETPGSVPPGRVPRTKEVILTNDLIDAARPGEEVEITGVFAHSYDYHLTQKSGFPVFQTHILANHVLRKEDAAAAANLTEHDVAEIMQLARDPRIGDRIVNSIAPSIYGHKHVKMALAMSLFGGVPKNVDDKHRVRGDVNCLLLGDPGTAKSQMLKYAEQTAPRAVYSTGKGASAVGLTASVHKDPLTREWTLEGGALVLADQGVCLIDEFDKMNEQDRTSIHEAMEQQSISVSKAGIVTSLQARCAVIAAANPIGGRYDSSCTLAENVELTDPILQRFDCLCVLQDVVDPVADERLANFVTGSHMRSVPTADISRGAAPAPELSREEQERDNPNSAQIIPQVLLKKYIQYARTNMRPVLRNNTFDQEKIASLYVALRRESASSGGVPVAVRHIESMMRMAEAHAKMHLREYVRDDDMDASIKVMLESFISAQKFSVRRTLRRSFAKYVSTGEDRAHLLLHILQDMMRNEAMYQTIRARQRNEDEEAALDVLEVPYEEFESKARDRRIYDVSEFCKGGAFSDAGYVLDAHRGIISRAN